MSSMALDLSLEGSCSLIRAYMTDPKAWAYGQSFAQLVRAWPADLPHTC